MTDQAISTDSSPQRYFASIPHMADDDLTMQEYRVYGHYVRVCGQYGKCKEKEATTIKKCGMGRAAFRKAREGLAEKGFITIVERGQAHTKGQKGRPYLIVLRDIWRENIDRYGKKDDAADPKKSSAPADENGKGSESAPLAENGEIGAGKVTQSTRKVTQSTRSNGSIQTPKKKESKKNKEEKDSLLDSTNPTDPDPGDSGDAISFSGKDQMLEKLIVAPGKQLRPDRPVKDGISGRPSDKQLAGFARALEALRPQLRTADWLDRLQLVRSEVVQGKLQLTVAAPDFKAYIAAGNENVKLSLLAVLKREFCEVERIRKADTIVVINGADEAADGAGAVKIMSVAGDAQPDKSVSTGKSA